MCKKITRLKTAYPNLITGDAVITDMQTMGVPWADLEINSYLDIMYYAHSANKIVSPIVNDFIESSAQDNKSLTATYRETLARIIVIKYNDKWSRLWAMGDTDYNPLDSDNLTETETIEAEHSKSGTDTGTITTDHDRTDTGTITDNGTNSDNDNIYGFNSSSAVGANTSSGTDTNTETRNLSSNDDITETRNLADSETGTKSSSRTLTKIGRSGSMVSGTRVQDLIEAEREVLQWNFWNVVFADIDEILALDIY